MKNTITLLVALALAISLHAQKGSFVKNYLKLRQPTNDSFVIQTIKGKELKHLIDSFKSDTTEKAQDGRRFLEKAKEITVIMDMDEEEQLSSEQLEKLLQPYEELVSMDNEGVGMGISGLMEKDRMKELIFLSQVEDELFFFVNVLFKKPIALEDYMDIDDPGNISKLFSINESQSEGKTGLVNFNFSREVKFDLYPDSFTLKMVRENDKYGVLMCSDRGEKYIIKPDQYNKEFVMYGPNPGNTYIKALYNHMDYHLLYDRYGFTIASGDEISPVYIADSEEVAFFIIKYGNTYCLYECPEKYELKTEDDGFSMRPPTGYRLTDCLSIRQVDNTLECVKADNSTEIITIREK